MKKLFLGLILTFLLFSFGPFSGYAATEDELRQKIQNAQAERAALQEEQRKLQAQLDSLSVENKSLSGAVKTLDTTKKKLETDIKLTQSKISTTDLNIQSLENSMNQKETEIKTHEQAIRSALQQISSYDSHNLVSDLLTYKKISEVWSDQGTLISIQDTLQKEILSLKDAQLALDKQKTQKEKSKEQLLGLKTELGGQKKVVENTKASKLQLLAATKSKEAAYQKLLADAKAREEKFEAELFLYESQLKTVLDKSLIPTAAPSILSWPVSKVKITQQFGRTSSSGRLYASGTHNGMDFGMPVGTPIMAVRGGIVSGAGNTDLAKGCYSYGRWVLIKHDNGLSTLYGHLSASLVQTGQSVSAGQVIGYSGGMPGGDGSGYSTGPHLHLGLYATQAVQIIPYTTSIGCKGTSIPIAPPNGYLDPLAYFPRL
jgi:murein DD-endopeptidase MepM/ murein hydrolase activator NlpD